MPQGMLAPAPLKVMIYPKSSATDSIESTIIRLTSNQAVFFYPNNIESLIEHWKDHDIAVTNFSILRNRKLDSVQNCNSQYVESLTQNEVSHDFMTEQTIQAKTLPVIWRVVENKLEVLSLTCPLRQTLALTAREQVLRLLFSQDFHRMFLERNPEWRTTLKSLDELNDVKESQKARSVRKLLLTKVID